MTERPLPQGIDAEKLAAAVLRALRDQHLDESLAGMLRDLVLDPDDRWRECCGNDCYVCMIPLARAVDQVRAELS